MSEFLQRAVRSDLFLAAVSGLLLGIGFYIPVLWPLVFVGLVPFLYVSARAPGDWKRRALLGLVLGLTLYGCALAAIFWHTLPVDWFGIESVALQVFAVGGSWLLAASILALGTVAFSVALPFVSSGWRSLLFVPLAWVLGEWLGAFLISILLAGPGSLLGAHFTLGYLGYLLAHEPALLQLAAVGGVYLLAAVAVLVNVLVFQAWRAPTRRERAAALIVVLAIGVFVVLGHWWLAKQPSLEGEGTARMAALSTYQPPQLHLTLEDEQERVDVITSLLGQIDEADAVLLPESAAYTRFADRDAFPNLALIVDTQNTREPSGDTYSRTVFHYADGSTEQSEKQFVLPVGEYIPYLYRLILLVIPNEDFREQVLGTRSFVSGSETQFARVGDGALAVRFCDESMSPHLYARDARGGAGILANVSSYSWFHGSREVFSQMQAVAKVRVVETGRWYLQSANMSPAYVLDHHGRVLVETEWNEPGVVLGDVSLRSTSTPYQWWGSWLPLLALLGTGVGIWLNRRDMTAY